MADQKPPITLPSAEASEDKTAPPPSSDNTSKSTATSHSSLTPPVTSLSDEDLRLLRIAIGVPRRNPDDGQPKLSWFWPPRTLPRGLYADVVTSRTKAQYSYYFTATLYNTCLVLQLLLGAALTALGSSASHNHLAITILAAANTVNAGAVALLHNSGLPGRLRNDWMEFDKVEMFLEELMETGIVEVGVTRDDAIATCWKKYMASKATVNANKPSVYTGGPAVNLGVPGAAGTGSGTGSTTGGAATKLA